MGSLICKYFNFPRVNYGNSGALDGNTRRLSRYDEILRNYQLYLGELPNTTYAFATTDFSNTPLPTVWINGEESKMLLDHIFGLMTNLLKSSRTTTRSLGQSAQNKRTRMMEMTELFSEMRKDFEDIAQQSGIAFSPLGGKEQEMEDIEKTFQYIEYDWKERFELIADRLGVKTKERNHYVEFFTSVFKYAIIGGVVGVIPRAYNGKIYWSLIRPENVIWDGWKDGDLNRDARYCGGIEWMTPGEVLETVEGLTPDMIKAVKNISSTGILPPSNGVLPFSPFISNSSAGPMIAVIHTYWRAMGSSRYKEIVDKDGALSLKKLSDAGGNKRKSKEKKMDGDLSVYRETWYKCSIVGTIGYGSYGRCYNLVENSSDRARIDPPMKIWIPQMTMGESTPLASRLRQTQERLDWLNNEITKLINNSVSGFIYRASKLANGGITSAEIANDLKRFGVKVITEESGDINDEDGKSMFYSIDLTHDKMIASYLQLMEYSRKIMKEYLGLSDIALGQQTYYVGASTQAASINQGAISLTPIMHSFMQFISYVLQGDINAQYQILAHTSKSVFNEDIPLVDEKDFNYIKQNPELLFDMVGVYIRFEDVIDAEARMRIDQKLMALAQNPNSGITPEDIVRFETFQTYTEAINYFEYVTKRLQRQQAQAQQAQQAIQEMQLQKQMQFERGNIETVEEGKNQRAGLEAATKMTANQDKQPDLQQV